jgi:hypothetical protein
MSENCNSQTTKSIENSQEAFRKEIEGLITDYPTLPSKLVLKIQGFTTAMSMR